MAITRFAGYFNALDFAYGCAGSAAPPLQVISGSTSTGAYTLTCFPQVVYTSAGLAIPISAACPINVGSDSGMDISITPSAVANNNLNQVNITGTFTYSHGQGAQVSSATFGLQEALLAASKNGGGIVVVDAKWFQAGGSQAILAAATQYADVVVQDNSGTSGQSSVQSTTVTLTAAQVNTMFTTAVQLLPTPDAASMYLVTGAVLVNKNGGTAWTGGGAIEIGYGSSLTTEALSGTVAATFLTSPTVTQMITLAGTIYPITTVAASTYLGKGIFINNATAVFATGTGVLEVTLQYLKIST